MDISSTNSLLNDLQLNNLQSYLAAAGWRSVDSDERWNVYHGGSDTDNNPFELVLPTDSSITDFKIYAATAVNLLSALDDEEPEHTIRRIHYYDTDVLTLRNLETGEYESITLQMAENQITYLKRLVAFSASSERDPRPFFEQPLSIGNGMVEHYRFGHTFRGSFGFTIESFLPGTLEMLNPGQKLLPGIEANLLDEQNLRNLPAERRVMERIVRGLMNTRKATVERDLGVLVENYGGGLNANMCEALVNVGKDRASLIEYDVIWSPKLAPADDLIDFDPFRPNETSYQLLFEASERLRYVEPTPERIKGLVLQLGAADNPFSDSEVTRSVVIRWVDRPDDAPPIKINVSLDRESYELALHAHRTWSTVEVTGIVEKIGSMMRLVDPTDFVVNTLPPGYDAVSSEDW